MSVSQIIAACARWAQNDLIYFVPIQNDLNGQARLLSNYTLLLHSNFIFNRCQRDSVPTTLDFSWRCKAFRLYHHRNCASHRLRFNFTGILVFTLITIHLCWALAGPGEWKSDFTSQYVKWARCKTENPKHLKIQFHDLMTIKIISIS